MVKIDVVFADPKEITDDEMSRLVDDEVVHYEIIDGGSLRGIPKMAKLKSLTAAKKTPLRLYTIQIRASRESTIGKNTRSPYLRCLGI